VHSAQCAKHRKQKILSLECGHNRHTRPLLLLNLMPPHPHVVARRQHTPLLQSTAAVHGHSPPPPHVAITHRYCMPLPHAAAVCRCCSSPPLQFAAAAVCRCCSLPPLMPLSSFALLGLGLFLLVTGPAQCRRTFEGATGRILLRRDVVAASRGHHDFHL